MRVEMNNRFEQIEKKLDEHDGFFASLSEKMTQLDERLEKLEQKPLYTTDRA